MNVWSQEHLVVLLRIAAAIQLCVAVLNLQLVRVLDWRPELQRMPLLVREVFQVHLWFISLTLTIFATLTWRFARDMAGTNEMADWLALGVGVFWSVRAVMQIAYYSARHWRGKLAPTFVHVALLLVYSCMSAVYCSAGIGAIHAWNSH